MASYAATFQGIQTAVIAKVNLDATADLAAVKDWINWACTDIANETEAFETTATLSLTAGTANYSLATVASGAILRIKEMYVTSSGTVTSPPLQYISLKDMLRLRVAAGGTVPYTGQPIRYTLSGSDRLDLYPTPATTGDTITFYYSYLPTALSANGDLQPFGEPWSKLVEYGALAEAGDFLGDPNTDNWRQSYEQWKARYKAHLNRRKGTQERRLGGDYAEGWPFHDPSTDLVRA